MQLNCFTAPDNNVYIINSTLFLLTVRLAEIRYLTDVTLPPLST